MGDRPRILVLDDDPLLRRALERVARQSGVALETVDSPDAVRARLVEPDGAFDLVVCDYRLRIGGRTETSTALVRELAGRGMKVAVMTGLLDSVEDEFEGVAMLEKPLRLDELVALAAR